VREDMIVAAIKHFEDTHTLVADHYWKAPRTHDEFGGELSLAKFQALREALVVMKTNYLHLFSDIDHLLTLDSYRGFFEEIANGPSRIKDVGY